MRLIPTRLNALILALALAVPGAAQAGPRDDIYALAAAIRDLGDGSRAAEIEVLAASMTDEDAQTLANAGIAQLAGSFQAIAQQRVEAAKQGVPPASPQGLVRSTPNLSVARSAGFPDPEYPSTATCFTSPDGSDVDQLFIAFNAVGTARSAVEGAEDILSGLVWACSTVVVAIGVGGNPQTVVCAVAEIALAVAKIALNAAEQTLAVVDFCDGALQWIDSRTTLERTGHIHDDLEAARVEILDRLETHDVDIKAVLATILAKLAVIENKLDLSLKSQAEIAMHTRNRTRPSVFYEERLDEICGYAQEAINDLPVVYLAASSAQAIYDRAIQFKITAPKRAADECIKAYLQATVRSDRVQ